MQSTVIDMTQNENFDNIVQELRRGVIVLAVLTQLQEELYGYTLLKRLSEKGLDVDQGTLYPLLRRLESQGLLESLWRLEEARPRRYYILSQAGKEMMPRLIEEWRKINTMLETMAA
jgi:DNA-binding PadR family transcriptional regulator